MDGYTREYFKHSLNNLAILASKFSKVISLNVMIYFIEEIDT